MQDHQQSAGNIIIEREENNIGGEVECFPCILKPLTNASSIASYLFEMVYRRTRQNVLLSVLAVLG
jgi:hypothetical protein